MLEETNDSGTVTARYTTESGSYYEPLLHMRRSSTEYFPLCDAIGTARMLVDDSATITDTYHLDAWGEQLGATGSTVNPYRYGGAWGYITDPSGMLQLGARFYWPEVGRFLQRDRVRDGVNAASYAANNPLAFVDPRGLWCVPIGTSHYSIWHQSGAGKWSAWTIEFTYLEHDVILIPPGIPVELPWSKVQCRYERFRELYGYWEKFWLTTYLCDDECGTYTKTVASGHKQVAETRKETDVRYKVFGGWFDEYEAVEKCKENVPQN